MSRYKEPIDLTPYCYPGIFRIYSIKTKRSLFRDANNVFFEMRDFFDTLREQGGCDNLQFLEDFKEYGVSNFKFFILEAGPEYSDVGLRKQILQQYKEENSNELYE